MNLIGNTVAAPLLTTGGDYGIFVESRNGGTNVCVDLFDNTATGSGAASQGIRFRQRTGSIMRLERLAASTSVPGTVATHLENTNTLATGASMVIDNVVTAVADGTCALP